MGKIKELQDQFDSEIWEIRLQAADSLASINTEAALSFLQNQLNSSNKWKRNAAALALMKTRNQDFFLPILGRIVQLGPKQDIGTLVFALENFDCSRHLHHIIQFHVSGNAEVRMSTTTILMKQSFKITAKERQCIEQYINDYNDLGEMRIDYTII